MNKTLKERATKICKSILVIVICVLGVKFIIDNRELFSFLKTLTLGEVGICAGTMIFNFFFTAAIDKTLMKALEVQLSWFDIITVTFVNAFLNCIMPFGSAYFIKAKYLKDKSGLSYTKFIALTMGVTFINFYVVILTTMAVLLMSGIEREILFQAEFMLGLGTLLSVLAFWLCYRINGAIVERLPFKRYLKQIVEGLYELSKKKNIISICAVLFLMGTLVISLRFMMISLFMGERISYAEAVFNQCAYSMSSLITILPGNIGINEIFVGIANRFLNSNFNTGVAITMVNRMIYYSFCFLAGIISWAVMRIKSKLKQGI